MSRDDRFRQAAERLGFDPGGEIRGGGNYTLLLRHDNTLYISGQVPRIGTKVVVTGRVGAEVSLQQAQRAAQICVLRALALAQQSLEGLDRVRHVLKMSVFVQCTDSFTQQSEVADGASALLYDILGDAGVHTRTAVGVLQLPKNAAVEIDMVVAIDIQPT